MSGDKLLGGPQAGIIVGSKEMIDRVRKNPFTRAMRVDKLTLAALEATLALYRDPPRALAEIPVLYQLGTSTDELRRRASLISRQLPGVTVVASEATVGGGAFPTARIPSVALQLSGNATALEERLRSGAPAVVARIADASLLIDLRTILPVEDEELVAALQAALA
jgi:L-seryl-tRNA(Ser) seleniumtransferase